MKKLLLALLLTTPVFAQEVLPIKEPSTVPVAVAPLGDKNSDPASVSLTVAGMAVITDATSTVNPTVFIEGNFPFNVGGSHLGRIYSRLGIGISPGNSTSFTTTITNLSLASLGDPHNFESVEGGFGYNYVIGQTLDGVIKTGLVAEVGFKTRRGTDPEPVDSVSHYWGVGIRMNHANGSALTILGGQDGELGQSGSMQVMAYGQLVLPKTAGIAMLVGDASFSFFAPVDLTLPLPTIPPGTSITIPNAGAIRSNIVQLGVAVDMSQVYNSLFNKANP